jgi:hypothetical protein
VKIKQLSENLNFLYTIEFDVIDHGGTFEDEL